MAASLYHCICISGQFLNVFFAFILFYLKAMMAVISQGSFSCRPWQAYWSCFIVSAVSKNKFYVVLKWIFCCYICGWECWIKIPMSYALVSVVLYWFSWIRIFVLLCMLSLQRISFQWLSCTNKGHMNTEQRCPHLSLFSAHEPLTFTLRGDGQCVPSSLKPLMPTACLVWVHSLRVTHRRVELHN